MLQRARPINVYGETVPGARCGGDTRQRYGGGARGRERALERKAARAQPRRARTRLPRVRTARRGPRATSSSATSSSVRGSRTWRSASGRRKARLTTPRSATDAGIRHFNVPAAASLTPRRTFAGSPRWIVGSPETVGGFSAACYYFARELKKTVNVPIGLVTAAYGGARLRNFTSEETLRQTRARVRGPRHPGRLSQRPDGGDPPMGHEMGVLVDGRPAEGWPALDAGVRRHIVENGTARTWRLGAVDRHQP